LAKEKVYKLGFYKGFFVVSGYEGQKVSEAKETIRDKMIKDG